MGLSSFCLGDSNLLVHIFVLLFGAGAWVAVNGIWVELPVMVPVLPESWNLASYLTIITQAGNLGPIIVTLMQIFCRRRLNERRWIYFILLLGSCACFCLIFVWDRTVMFGSSNHSLPLFILWFFISFVDCTSSVTFLPFMKMFPSLFLTTYFIGEGLSGFIPSVFALIQGASDTNCKNVSYFDSATNLTTWSIQAVPIDPRFSVSIFFGLVFLMMVICSSAFLILNHSKLCKALHIIREKDDFDVYESVELQNTGQSKQLDCCGTEIKTQGLSSRAGLLEPVKSLSHKEYIYYLIIIFIVNALSNGVLPSLSTYSSLPYGETPYHLAQALGNMANPTACIIALLAPISSAIAIGVCFLASLGFSAFLLLLAIQSPCPLFVNEAHGAILMVAGQILWVGMASYVKVCVAQVFRERGHKHSLLWYGAVVQLGSMTGAFSLFPIVQDGTFKSGNSCANNCA